MPDYVIYNPASSPVTGIVTHILRSFDEGKEGTLSPDRIKNPDLSGLDLSKRIRWNGTALANLTQAEIDTIAADRTSTRLTELKQAAKDIFLAPTSSENKAIALGFETVLEMMVSELNLLRAAVTPPLAARTNAQVKTAFRNQYEAKIDSLS